MTDGEHGHARASVAFGGRLAVGVAIWGHVALKYHTMNDAANGVMQRCR